MKKLFKSKNIGLALMASLFLFIVVKASTSYTVSVTQFNDSEFPRVQVAMNISGNTESLYSRDIEIEEGGKSNAGPQVFLPTHTRPSKVNLHILVDTSGRTSKQENLIRSNLKALFHYIYDSEINGAIHISTFDDSYSSASTTLSEAMNNLNELTFTGEASQKIDGFRKIIDRVENAGSSGGQKVLLVVNGSDFEDNSIDSRRNNAIAAVETNEFLAFLWGHPVQKIHAVRASNQMAELVDFSHLIPGGYLGGFGADLTSMVDL